MEGSSISTIYQLPTKIETKTVLVGFLSKKRHSTLAKYFSCFGLLVKTTESFSICSFLEFENPLISNIYAAYQ